MRFTSAGLVHAWLCTNQLIWESDYQSLLTWKSHFGYTSRCMLAVNKRIVCNQKFKYKLDLLFCIQYIDMHVFLALYLYSSTQKSKNQVVMVVTVVSALIKRALLSQSKNVYLAACCSSSVSVLHSLLCSFCSFLSFLLFIFLPFLLFSFFLFSAPSTWFFTVSYLFLCL